MKAFFRLFSFALCMAFGSLATAQTVTGTLDGHITDQAGAVVPMVNVTARNVATGAERSTTSNDTGYFQMLFLPLGEYQVKASAPGFATVIAEKVV